jgi:hypothetical protein
MTGHCGKNVEGSTTFLKVVVKSWEWRHDDDHHDKRIHCRGNDDNGYASRGVVVAGMQWRVVECGGESGSALTCDIFARGTPGSGVVTRRS